MPPYCRYVACQLESGANTGYVHYQAIFHLERKMSKVQLLELIGTGIWCELTYAPSSNEYPLKDRTYIEPFRFEFGEKVIKRNNSADWQLVYQQASRGTFEEIPADIRVRHYLSLRRIYNDSLQCVISPRRTYLFWGTTGSGKTQLCIELFPNGYYKDPCNLWFDGYSNQETIIIDEFRGDLPVSNLLRWCDQRVPVLLQTKGGHRPLMAQRIIITSNLPLEAWYPNIDSETLLALKRRIVCYKFPLNTLEKFVLKHSLIKNL